MNDHTAEALVVSCIDYRLQEAINNWISKNFSPKTFDRVALAGGVKNLDTIMGQIDIALRLHHIKKVILINHEDCGAYGEAGTPQKHAEDLRNAKAKAQEIYPELEVETYYLHLDGTFESIS
ncbi:hypothetical protein HYS94_04055 [Candidatus Daviesbacteria bacterium]|nr:hypothetical protein [Candidatus Daviesbacteria bacterium]